MMRFLLAAYTILLREFILFYRQRSRIVGVLLQPLLFWLFIGTGMNSIVVPSAGGEASYMEYFFPGIVLLVIMFTAIFSTITVIEDRKQGFLRGVIMAPVPRASIAAGKMMAGALLGLLQALLMLMLIFTPLLSLSVSPTSFLQLVGVMLLIGFGLTGLGTIIAWVMDSVQGYHGIMSVLLFPLWIFSGAVYPVSGTPGWLHAIMTANPLTHGLELMRGCFTSAANETTIATASRCLPLTYVLASCTVIFLVANYTIASKE